MAQLVIYITIGMCLFCHTLGQNPTAPDHLMINCPTRVPTRNIKCYGCSRVTSHCPYANNGEEPSWKCMTCTKIVRHSGTMYTPLRSRPINGCV